VLAGATYLVLQGREPGPGEVAGEIYLEPLGVQIPDPFTEPVVSGAETRPTVTLPVLDPRPAAGSAPTGAPVQVSGGAPGLYGGTREAGTCDAERLVTFLEADAEKGAAWAQVHGIQPAAIRSYVDSLTPLVLTRDTRVINHGYANGRATPRTSVLEAGTAVLVDDRGVPRVKCGCGNPLAPATNAQATTYVGTPWQGFRAETVVIVTASTTVIEEFVVLDLTGGQPFLRKSGPTAVVSELSRERLCADFPGLPACTEQVAEATEPPLPEAEAELLFSIESILAVFNGPTAPSVAQFDRAVTITEITTYHWNDAQGAAAGTIGLRAADGTMHGPWPVTEVREGQGGVPSAYWTVRPDVTVPPGSYEVIDSDPGTWSQNAETGGRGMVYIYGYTAGPAVADEHVDSGDGQDEDVAILLVNDLLTSCGIDVMEVVSQGRGGPAGSWLIEARTLAGPAGYLVFTDRSEAVPQDPLAGEYAADCGFGGG
jgi:hypothetical protein